MHLCSLCNRYHGLLAGLASACVLPLYRTIACYCYVLLVFVAWLMLDFVDIMVICKQRNLIDRFDIFEWRESLRIFPFPIDKVNM